MNKKQQIEENAKVIPEKIKDPLDNSRYIIFGKSLRREIARIYYNAGYRKLPEDSVVLSKEEYERLVKTAQGKIGNMKSTDFLKACISSGVMVEAVSTEEQVKQAYEKGCKETAEKILNELNNLIKNNEDFGRGVFGWKTEEILMLLKIYADKQGVEIKEL